MSGAAALETMVSEGATVLATFAAVEDDLCWMEGAAEPDGGDSFFFHVALVLLYGRPRAENVLPGF